MHRWLGVLFMGFIGCVSVAQSTVDRATGVSPTERLNREWNDFERRPVNAPPNASTFACVSGSITTAGPLGAPVADAFVEWFEDGTAQGRMTTRADGSIRICTQPTTKHVRVEVRHSPHATKTVEYDTDAAPRSLDVVLTR